MRLGQPGEALGDRVPELLGLERGRASVLAEDPAREQVDVRVLGLEDAVLDRSGVGERALDPPGGVVRDGDPRGADRLADLPRPRDAMLLDVEVGGNTEVPLAAGCEADVAADPRDLERAHAFTLEVVSDDVPVPVVEPERVRVHGAVGASRSQRAQVAELHRPLLRDRRLELREPPRELRRVVGSAHADALGGLGRRLREAGAPEREVLEREAERLRVRELSLEVVERGLERRQLVVVELEAVEEVVLRAQRVELLARELVPLRLEGHAERRELGAVRVEAARERLVRHLRVALDVRLDVPRRQRPPLGHEEGDERELPDELVGVVRHAEPSLASSVRKLGIR